MQTVVEDTTLIIEILKKTLVLLNKIQKQSYYLRVKNKGTGAGGKKTNENGLNYEELTSLSKLLHIEETKTHFGNCVSDYYHTYNNLIITQQYGRCNYLQKHFNKNCEKKLKPDECIIDDDNAILYILEKKFQHCDGLVDYKQMRVVLFLSSFGFKYFIVVHC